MRNLFLANVAILALDICLLSLEFAALWGVWCTFKGFAYSVKLKIEFAILNQLRDTITKPATSSSAGTGTVPHISLSGQRRHRTLPETAHGEVPQASFGHQAGCFGTGLRGGGTIHSEGQDQILKTTEYSIHRPRDRQGDRTNETVVISRSPSPSSSRIDFTTKGA